jgi:hypothetical protein
VNIDGFVWPDEPLGLGGVVRSYVPDEERTDPATICDPTHTPAVRIVQPMKTIGEECGIEYRKKGSPTIHDSGMDTAQKLIRLIEELLEREDLTIDADVVWYRNRLREIKAEINDQARGVPGPGEA